MKKSEPAERRPSGDIDYRVRCVMTTHNHDGTMEYQVVRYGVAADECGHSPWAEVNDDFDHSAGQGRHNVAEVPRQEYFFTPGLGRNDEVVKSRRGSVRR